MTLRPDKQKADNEQGAIDGSEPISGKQLKTGWAGAERAGGADSTCGVYRQPSFDWLAADAYLFDIDGTLLNSHDAVHYHAFHRAVNQVFGLDMRLDGIPVHGNTDVGILRAYLRSAGIPEEQWRPRLPEVFELMAAEVEHNGSSLRPELCPSIPELIQYLRSRGKLLGVASGNLERVGWSKLRACGLREYFSFGAFSGARETRDEVIGDGIEQAREIRGSDTSVFVVGDTPADIRSAHANGIPVIAVATGIYSFDELLGHSPEMCASCCTDLMASFSLPQGN